MWWSWVLTIIGGTAFILAGKKLWWCWYVNLACQVLWFIYGWTTGQYGFVFSALFFTAIFGRNAYKWTRDRNLDVDRKESAAHIPLGVRYNKRTQSWIVSCSCQHEEIAWLWVRDHWRGDDGSGWSVIRQMLLLSHREVPDWELRAFDTEQFTRMPINFNEVAMPEIDPDMPRVNFKPKKVDWAAWSKSLTDQKLSDQNPDIPETCYWREPHPREKDVRGSNTCGWQTIHVFVPKKEEDK